MAYRTTAFDAADALGWDMDELARRSGVPPSTLYMVRRGVRGVGSKTMLGLRRAFPHLSFDQLFVLIDNTNVQKVDANAPEEPVAA
jgi:predicted transcriptional regulator